MAKDEINAFLGAGTNYHGKLNFQGSVRIDGSFTGEVDSDGTLVIGKDAVVEGTIRVGQLVLSGRLTGEVEARQKVALKKSADMKGDIRTPVLIMDEGAVLEGKLTMGSQDALPSGSES
ncbi:protein CcmA, bactofilin family [Paucidesulfovibrio gracilis DSM 16080]|uniref:Protein CcmA, bactofilin family n=1 Tax=Paucidesulfovibrio gracilis DSM 16080 TaxID=1121449 RepID=A0A1T4XK87_9BACT|nr:polymer-forming cytoskeletal protein [Paucidesulfovibrio gracilis]SKA89578.1 protein CcmA, bactofilin family [Paucidesulfovibrio gracilis DSM 16080]